MNVDSLSLPQPLSLEYLTSHPLVSILTPCYNAAKLINQTLDCIVNQTYKNWEMVICDDGSKDDSWAKLQAIAARESRVKLLQQENGGSAAATNTAYCQCTGDIIVFLDADDLSDPDRLQVIVQAFVNHPDCGFITHRLRTIDADGKILKGIVPGHPLLVSGWFAPKVFDMRIHGCSSPTSGIAIRRQVLERIMPIPDRCRRTQDAYLIATSLLLTRAVGIDQIHGSYRIHAGGQTSGKKFRKEWHEGKIIDQTNLATSLCEFAKKIGHDEIQEWIHQKLMIDSPELMREIACHWLSSGELHPLSPHRLEDVFQRMNSKRWLFRLAALSPRVLRPAILYTIGLFEKLRVLASW